MTAIVDLVPRGTIHPFHAFLLAGAVPLFLGALLSDIAYAQSYQIQWSNFASWLIAGALVFAGFSMLWALVDLFSASRRSKQSAVYFVLLLVAWVLGFINALEHAKDAWAIMPTSVVLSAIVALLVCAAAWFGLATVRVGGAT